MICKYCGARYTGNKCPACGKVIPLVKRSTDLDKLMSGPAGTNDPGASRTKTYEQGVREGYRQGLKAGYDNGLAEGKENQIPVVQPPKRKLKKAVILCASITLLLSAASGFLFSKTGYNSGYQSGYEAGYSLGTEEGAAKGREEGRKTAEEAMKPQLEERYEAGKKDGYQAAADEFEARSKETDEKKEAVAPAETPELDFPYSQQRHKSAANAVVRKIQKQLNELGYKVRNRTISVDGYYGPDTESAVRSFQKQNGLEDTGEVDSTTYRLLFPEESIPEENEPEQTETGEEPSDIPKLPVNPVQIPVPLSTSGG